MTSSDHGSTNGDAIGGIFNDPQVLDSLPCFSRPPVEFVCPLSRVIMKDPVQSQESGIVFDSAAIQTWRSQWGDICPLTRRQLGNLTPHQELREKINNWRQQIKGLRRIRRKTPTTYCLVDSRLARRSTMSPRSQYPKEKGNDVSASATSDLPEHMFAQVNSLLPSFVDAGISDYRHRVVTRLGTDGGGNLGHNGDETSIPSQRTYRTDFYPSIFNHGTKLRYSRSI